MKKAAIFIMILVLASAGDNPAWVGYTAFAPMDYPAPYTNFANVPHRVRNGEIVRPTPAELDAARASGVKLIIQLDRCLVEPIDGCGFDKAALREFAEYLEPWRDVVLAIYPVNEPYKPQNRYTERWLRQTVWRVRRIFPGYPIYVNFLSPYWSQLGDGFPAIPDNIDVIGFNSYHSGLTEQQYKAIMARDIGVIQDRAHGRPVIMSVAAFTTSGQQPSLEQAWWDYDLYRDHGLAGLRWFFWDDTAGTWNGASHFPDLLVEHEQIGRLILGRPTPEPIPTVIRDLAYGPGPLHKLDLYVVPGAPAVVWFHGGGLVTGDKAWTQAATLHAAGFTVASANYRLNPDTWMPGQIEDAILAVRWVRDHAGVYGYDASRVGAIGGSAGAFLAASLATEGHVEASVPMAGIYSFEDYFSWSWARCYVGDESMRESCTLQYFFGCSLVDQWCRDNVARSSARNHVTPDDPPVLLLIGELDATPNGIPDHQAFHDAMLAACVDSTLVIVPGAEHGECFGLESQRVIDFFGAHLR